MEDKLPIDDEEVTLYEISMTNFKANQNIK